MSDPQMYPGAAQPTGPAPGGVLERFVARLLDGFIVGLPVAIVVYIVFSIIGIADNAIGAILMSLIVVAAEFAYFVYFETSRGQTIGKQVMKLRTVGVAGGNPTQDEVLKRNAWLLLSAIGGIPILGIIASLASLAAVIAIAITISSDPFKQGWHDKFAGGTRVIKV